MKSVKLALIASACLVTACHKNDTSTETATNDQTVGTDNMANNNDDASMTNTSATATNVDKSFVKVALEGDNGEVAIGNLAATKASSQAAKDFGKMLATDHGAHKQKVAVLASSAGVTVTDEPSAEGKKI